MTMAYFEDLVPCDYFGPTQRPLVAVGWLAQGHPYSKGEVSRSFFGSLTVLAADPWEPVAFAGRQQCPFCVFSGGPGKLVYEGTTVPLGATNIFVPGDEGLFVAPSLIVHYIDAHEYLPPEVFQAAVRQCPPMRSMEYLRSVRRLGGADIRVPKPR
jgi:hypothetical protein